MVVFPLTALVGTSMNVGAADSTPGSPPSAKWTSAKILTVDRAAKAVTVDIHGTIHLVWLNAAMRLKKDGKDAGIPDLIPGQIVYLNVQQVGNSSDVVSVMEIAIYTGAPGGGTGPPAANPGLGANATTKKAGTESGRGVPSLFNPAPVVRPTVSPYY